MISKLSSKQKQIFKFVNSKSNYLICDGAVRSGKTVIMSIAFIIWAMEYFESCNFAICAKTVTNAERNVLKPLITSKELPYKMKYHRQERMLEVSMGTKVNRFYLFGGKDESSYMLIQGITLAGVLMDEVALMPRSFVEQAMARTLTYANAKIWFNCNPSNQLHWFNQEWIIPTDKGEKNATHLHFLMTDNPILGEEEIKKTESMFSGVFFDRYILGLWCMAEGIIYDMFTNSSHVFNELPNTEGDYYVSSDFGIQNATVFLLWRKEKNTDRWICVNEYYYSGRENRVQKTVDSLVDGLVSILPREKNYSGEDTIVMPRQVIVDPSASALIVELRKRGFHVIPAINDVLNGISDVSTMLRQDKLGFAKKCVNTINEFGLYSWDAKASQHGEDRPIKDNDHAMDAVRYFVETKHLVKKMR